MQGVQSLDGMLVGLDCHNKIPHTGWLKQKIPISHNSGGGKPKIKVPADLASGESSLPGLQTVAF